VVRAAVRDGRVPEDVPRVEGRRLSLVEDTTHRRSSHFAAFFYSSSTRTALMYIIQTPPKIPNHVVHQSDEGLTLWRDMTKLRRA